MTYAQKLSDGLIAALATPPGKSALAVIRTSGPGAVGAVARLFSRSQELESAEGHSMIHGLIRDPQSQNVVDEVVLGVYRGTRSYTGEEMVEIFCHGSPPGISALLDLLFEYGFRQAEPGEFSLRAFLNGKMDLTRAEAVQEIIEAQNRNTHALALNRLGGSLERKIEGLKQELLKVMAAVSVQLDYPDDEIDLHTIPLGKIADIASELATLGRIYQSGRIYIHGARVVMAGRTNAGKSSLFNALVREERAIVSETHGTTRDYLEVPFTVEGLPIRLFDTAGLRETEESVELEGIRRSERVIEGANLVVYVVDGSALRETPRTDGNLVHAQGPSWSDMNGEDSAYLAAIRAQGTPLIVAWNKSDAESYLPPPEIGEFPVVATSANKASGIDVLLKTMATLLKEEAGVSPEDLAVGSDRQSRLIERAAKALALVVEGAEAGLGLDLIAVDLQDALGALGEITGEVTRDDILEAMFSGFCVGK